MADPRPLAIALVAAALPAVPAAGADYVTIRNAASVDAPVDRVWARIGGWCAIADWLAMRCETMSGSGDVGSVRRLNGVTVEVMVAHAATSYTYWQTAGAMAGYGFHGTLAATPAAAGGTVLTYTLVYDQAAMPSDAVRMAERARLQARFAAALQTMKTLVGSGR